MGAAHGALRSQAEALLAALDARDELVAALAHELRNGLAPLLLLAEQVPPGGELPASRVALLGRYLAKLARLIDRIGEVAQLRRDKLVLRLVRVDLGELAAGVVARLQPDARGSGSVIELDAEPAVIGMWDRDRIERIVSALLVNAIEHGRPRALAAGSGANARITTSTTTAGAAIAVVAALAPARIDVRIRALSPVHAEIVVRDRGAGVPGEQRAHLFDRVDHKGPRGNAIGVGLWVVKALCDAMDGAIAVQHPGELRGPATDAKSISDGGARFCVTLRRD